MAQLSVATFLAWNQNLNYQLPTIQNFHKYFQKIIETQQFLHTKLSKIASKKECSASAEKIQIKSQSNNITFYLNTDNKRFAIELSVSTSDLPELSKLQKCFTADFEKIILCTEDKNKLKKINLWFRKNIQRKTKQNPFFQSEELFSFIKAGCG